MKVGLLSGPGTLTLADRPAPTSGPGEVVVALAACGVCGTDLEKVRGHYQTAGRLGHEPVGRVEAVGPGVRGLTPGDRVVVHHHVPCYACAVCRAGDYPFCPSYAATNIDPGGFAERFRVPRENVDRGAVQLLDPSIDWATGTLLEPAGCVLTALRRLEFRSGSTAFVIGLGPVGLLYTRVLAALGARWVGGAELSSHRRVSAVAGGLAEAVEPARAAETVAAATDGAGADLVVVATGAPAAVRSGTELVRRGGTLNLFGLPDPGSRLDVDLQALYLHGTRVVPTYATTERDLADLQAMVRAGRVNLQGLVTHAVPLARIDEAFRVAADPETSIKVVVTGPAFA